MNIRNMKYKGELSLLLVAILWGAGFIMTAEALESFSPFQSIAFRFLLSAIILGVAYWKHLKVLSKQEITHGIILGTILFLAYGFQTIGLTYTTPAKNAFLTATNVAIVPFVGRMFYGQRVDRFNVCGGLTALIGIAVMSTIDGAFNIGDGLTLLGALMYAFQLFFVGRFKPKNHKGVVTVQLGTCGFIALMVMLVFRQTNFTLVQPRGIIMVVLMAIFTTALCFSLQMWGQKNTPPTKAGIILGMECIFGAVFSVMGKYEDFSINMLMGAILIVAGVMIIEVKPRFIKKVSIVKKWYPAIIAILIFVVFSNNRQIEILPKDADIIIIQTALIRVVLEYANMFRLQMGLGVAIAALIIITLKMLKIEMRRMPGKFRLAIVFRRTKKAAH